MKVHPIRPLVLAIALACGCRARERADATPPRDSATLAPGIATSLGVIFPDARARGLYRQCSRATPERTDGEWTPTLADVAALERELPAFLATVDADSVFYGRLRPLGSFIRQYGGFTRGGRRFVYASFSLRLPDDVMRERGADSLYWRRAPVYVCDGGPGFFGVEYDVEAHTFSELHVNGVA